jgi:hypothetical protein
MCSALVPFGSRTAEGSGIYTDDTRAGDEWKEIGCSGPLPIELDGGNGTVDGHWDEKCLLSELMTGFISSSGSPSPQSRSTIGTLEDMGLVVDYSQADNFTIDGLGVCGSFCSEA